jgi:hypothetical protein
MTNFWGGKYQNWNFDGDMTANGVAGGAYAEFRNYWWAEAWSGARAAAIDDQRTRGGPAIRSAGNHYFGGAFGNDQRKRVSFNVWTEISGVDDGGEQRGAGWTVNFRPNPAVRISFSPSYSEGTTASHYVTTLNDPSRSETFGKAYIFAALEQRQFDVGIRTEWTVSPTLSMQLYLQPFVASGDYSGFKQLVRPRDNEYVAAAAPFEPDFNYRSVRGSAVVRWEFRPGSSLYAVWNQNRSDVAPVGDFGLRRDLSALTDAPSHDVVMLKLSYWLPM